MDIHTDVLIVGSGIAGLYSALNLRSDLKVLIVTKTKVTDSNSYLAQGGISVARGEDDLDLFISDTMKAGHFENDQEAVKVMVRESISNVNLLMELGLSFDKVDNRIHYTREGAHSVNRVVHCKDETGKHVIDGLYHEVKKRDNIKVLEDSMFLDIIEHDRKCVGGIIIRKRMHSNIFSKATILATGGIGGLFRNSTNHRNLVGDGIAVATRHNIFTERLDYIQFHPTSLYEDKQGERRLLVSEAVRGEGGKLVNILGERFVDELLPRDVVSNAIYMEQERTGYPFVYLDIRFRGRDFLEGRFPFIFRECLSRGMDMSKDLIPVTPAQHYFMGGIKVDLKSATSMENLYACGETSSTGCHGANRLASNSLLEAMVFSRRAALDINSLIDSIADPDGISYSKKVGLESFEKENREITIGIFNKVLGERKDELVCG